ncbi:MAG: tetratricopeptide repeat protein [Nitrospiraceae bacterium]|nr:MAG: tetratricopeptide repeat protein [Nitrospiraceae bacterium]
MKVAAMIFLIMFFTISPCLAQKTPMEKAYALYFQGKMQDAITIMEGEAEKNPDPKTFYFIGYAYYKMNKMELAREYFDKAYKAEAFYSPPVKENK